VTWNRGKRKEKERKREWRESEGEIRHHQISDVLFRWVKRRERERERERERFAAIYFRVSG